MGSVLVHFQRVTVNGKESWREQETLCISSGREIIPSSLLSGDISFLNVNTLSLTLIASS